MSERETESTPIMNNVEENKNVKELKTRREIFTPERIKLLLALLTLQLCFVCNHIITRVALLNVEFSKIVFLVYRNILALLLLGPCAYFFEKNDRKPLTFSLLLQIFFIAVFGVTSNQVLYLLGLYYATPTFASAMQNSIPAITFAIAAAIGLEKVNILRRDGLAKILGTVAAIGGATIMTLYKGMPVLQGISLKEDMFLSMQNFTLGCLYLLAQCLSWGAWLNLQAVVLKKYPAKLSITAMSCFIGLIQITAIAAIIETDPEQWKIKSVAELTAILYTGIVTSGFVFTVQTWCIQKGGPVLVAVVQPFQTVLVAFVASLLLGDQLYTGGIIGAVLVVLGLYSVLWGKVQERKLACQTNEEALTRHLLDAQSKEEECLAGGIP
ncbi:EamA domain [Dillenia turbinata]|uniref:WAT1-related protein n=1 Tax=Dillenia turbinata TaxID=194707 RepID=A0AAN8UQC9_9MAGN